MGGESLSALERRIDYRFKNAELLNLALTHKSHGRDNNERLEFLGDAVLGYVVGGMLFRQHPDWREDALSLARAHLVRGVTLAEIGQELKLGEFIRLGTGERKSGGSDRSSIQANAVEAIIGAVHEDGGIDAAVALIEKLFGRRARVVNPEILKDPKTQLQEILQSVQRPLPEYEVVEVSGEAHARRYTVRCTLTDASLSGKATASSRREAEKAAAQTVMDQYVND
ncbi:MAG: ribonuclease III [Pseudomonadales bacterium]|nr:ribonuclease III [Pseudomonadales bacterium]